MYVIDQALFVYATKMYKRERHVKLTVTSGMCIFVLTCFIVSIGQGDPAIMPVRSDDKLNVWKSGWFNMSINMVGTPYKAVHLQHYNFSMCFYIVCMFHLTAIYIKNIFWE